VVDGFGNHAPGSGRAAQARSPWDELHPGRPWAARLPRPRLSTEMITEEVRAHLAHLVVPDLDATPVLDVDTEVALQREAAVRLATATMTRRHSRPPDPTPCRPAAIASRRGTLHRDPPTDCQDPP
jgi:hypothetical protein